MLGKIKCLATFFRYSRRVEFNCEGISMRMPSRDDMIAMSVSNSASAYKGYYSAPRDFTDGLATEADNVKFAKEQQEEINLQQKEEEKKSEQTRDGVSTANASFREYKEAQENKMREINGRHFSDSDLEETINEIIEDKEAFQKKHNLTDEQADLALEHAMIMQGMTRDERDAYMDKLRQTEPAIANAIADDAQENHKSKLEIKKDTTLDNEVTENEAEIFENKLDNIDAMLAGIEDTELVQQSYADGIEAIKKSNIGQSTQEPQQVAEINEVTPVSSKGMTFGG